MSEQIELIKEILNYVEKYHKESGKTDIEGFSSFLSSQVSTDIKIGSKWELDKEDYKNYKKYAEIEFSALLTNLYRFAKHYIKKALSHTDIKTLDEFGFLATLLREKSLLKKDIINLHLLETSSGSEVLKRLKAKDLVVESVCETDKRARLVSLTPKGMETIMNSFEEMHKVSEIVIGNLSGDEIKQVLKVFNELNDFHQNIYKCDKDSELTEIYNNHIRKTK